MNKEEFKAAFDRFDEEKERVPFNEDQWNAQINKWKEYYELIKSESGLPIKKWLKEGDSLNYLPNFLDTGEQKFGHSRIGNYDQVMIYRYNGDDENRKNKIVDKYKRDKSKEKDKSKEICKDISEVEGDYSNNIKDLLKEIVSCENVDAVFDLEKKDQRYKDFACKQILRKITILMSVMSESESPYPNAFAWFFNEKTIDGLARLLNIEFNDNPTFLKKNYEVYKQAKDWAGLGNSPDKAKLIKLYNFMLELVDIPSEFTDFRNPNVIFNGAPGTGKTYGVLKGIELLQSLDKETYKDSKYIQFHPSFSYEDFIEGIKPCGITGNVVNLKVVNGLFKEFCIHVREENETFFKNLKEKPDPKEPLSFKTWPHYFFVVDEINRGNISNILGETFTLLESGYRDYDFSGRYTKNSNLVSTPLSKLISKLTEEKDDLVYKEIDDEVYFGIPFNIHFIGIMNDVDRSIDPFDLALRRRFKWVAKECDYDALRNRLTFEKFSEKTVDDFVESCKNLNSYICTSKSNGLALGKTYEIGHAFFMRISEFSTEKRADREIKKGMKAELFSAYLEGTIKEYIRQAVDESEVDDKLKGAKAAFGIDDK